jgi:hypothetical protein
MPIQSSIQWVPGSLSLAVKWPRLWIRGAIHPFNHNSSWLGDELSTGTTLPMKHELRPPFILAQSVICFAETDTYLHCTSTNASEGCKAQNYALGNHSSSLEHTLLLLFILMRSSFRLKYSSLCIRDYPSLITPTCTSMSVNTLSVYQILMVTTLKHFVAQPEIAPDI